LCIKLVNHRDKYTEMQHGQQNVRIIRRYLKVLFSYAITAPFHFFRNLQTLMWPLVYHNSPVYASMTYAKLPTHPVQQVWQTFRLFVCRPIDESLRIIRPFICHYYLILNRIVCESEYSCSVLCRSGFWLLLQQNRFSKHTSLSISLLNLTMTCKKERERETRVGEEEWMWVGIKFAPRIGNYL